jgi:ArsR family transcriptional regulator, arsenate/arsenite/antimonite-responsive transcriptional repressor
MVNKAQASASCCGLAVTPLGATEAGRIAGMFKALGDPIRLRLAALIAAEPEVCVCDLTVQFTQADSTISHHLKVLRDAGLVGSERRGTWVYYRILPEALEALGVLLRPASSGVEGSAKR